MYKWINYIWPLSACSHLFTGSCSNMASSEPMMGEVCSLTSPQRQHYLWNIIEFVYLIFKELHCIIIGALNSLKSPWNVFYIWSISALNLNVGGRPELRTRPLRSLEWFPWYSWFLSYFIMFVAYILLVIVLLFWTVFIQGYGGRAYFTHPKNVKHKMRTNHAL